jgi:uncharacterized membrane protein YdbT with pleckstrin-like domain
MQNTPRQEPGQATAAGRPEETLCRLKPSMWRNQPFTFVLYILLLISPAIAAAVGWAYELNVKMLAALALVPAAFAGMMLTVWKLRCASTELTVTTKRCILRHGIMSRFTTEVRHCDIRNIQVAQSLFQRICGVGSMCISSEAEDEHDISVSGIAHPEKVAEMIRKCQ